METKKSIVVVDDDVDVSQVVKMMLEKSGLYSVTICNRGSEAIEVIQKVRPQLVLLDIMMPDADGTDIADQIRSDKSLAFVKVVFMTSLVSPEEVLRSSEIGGRSFISKPISCEALLEQVKGFLEIGTQPQES